MKDKNKNPTPESPIAYIVLAVMSVGFLAMLFIGFVVGVSYIVSRMIAG